MIKNVSISIIINCLSSNLIHGSKYGVFLWSDFHTVFDSGQKNLIRYRLGPLWTPPDPVVNPISCTFLFHGLSVVTAPNFILIEMM